MKLKLIAIGRMKRGPFAELAEDYSGRIQKMHPFEVLEIPESTYRSANDISRPMEQETQQIRRRLKAGTYLIALDEKGRQFTSIDFAKQLKKYLESPVQEIVFVVGGAYGLSDSLKQDAKLHWSLSKLTLPHQLARVFALEQIYRSLTILKNIPYHHD